MGDRKEQSAEFCGMKCLNEARYFWVVTILVALPVVSVCRAQTPVIDDITERLLSRYGELSDISGDQLMHEVFAAQSQRRIYDTVLANLRREFGNEARFLALLDRIDIDVSPLVGASPDAWASGDLASVDLAMVFLARNIGSALAPLLSGHPQWAKFQAAYGASLRAPIEDAYQSGEAIDLLAVLLADNFRPDTLESDPFWLAVFQDSAANFSAEVLSWIILHEIAHLEQFEDSGNIPDSIAEQKQLELDADLSAFLRLEQLGISLLGVTEMLASVASVEGVVAELFSSESVRSNTHPSWTERAEQIRGKFDHTAAPKTPVVYYKMFSMQETGLVETAIFFPRDPVAHGGVMGGFVSGSNVIPIAIEFIDGQVLAYGLDGAGVAIKVTIEKPELLWSPIRFQIFGPDTLTDVTTTGHHISLGLLPSTEIDRLTVSPRRILKELAETTWPSNMAARVEEVQGAVLDRGSELMLEFNKGKIEADTLRSELESMRSRSLGALRQLVGTDGVERFNAAFAAHPLIRQGLQLANSQNIASAPSGASRAPTAVEKPPSKYPRIGSERPTHLGIYVNPIDGQELVFLGGGNFTMGAPPDAEIDVLYPEELVTFDDAKPAHDREVAQFYLARTEVTNAQYARFLAAEGGAEPMFWRDTEFNAPDQPVVGVSWFEAQTYAGWVGGRLPTEPEWEYAAKAGRQNLAYATANGTIDRKLARYEMMYSRGPRPNSTTVGSYPPNPFGLYDLSGNAAEWCGSWYHAYPHLGQPVGGSSVPREVGELFGQTYRVMRGGSYESLNVGVMTFRRWRAQPSDKRGKNLGFRIAISAN